MPPRLEADTVPANDGFRAVVGHCTHCKARKSDNDQRTSRYAFIHHYLGQPRKPPHASPFLILHATSFEHEHRPFGVA